MGADSDPKNSDPKNLTDDEIKSLCNIIREKIAGGQPPDFLYRNDTKLGFNLILDTTYEENSQDKARYLVISPPKSEGFLGKGGFNTVRAITHAVTLDLKKDQVIEMNSVDDLVVRIRNQKKSSTRMDYKHETAEMEYETAKNFPHLGSRRPVKVTRERIDTSDPTANTQLQEKSLSVCKLIKGGSPTDSAYEQAGYIGIQDVIKDFVLPILEAYKNQIANPGFVHRDIKPENIMYSSVFNKDIGITGTANFIDVDTALKIDESKDPIEPAGTAGYQPPEVLEGEAGKPMKQGRDIFGLGIIIAECFNYNLNPGNYLGALYQTRFYTGSELFDTMNDFLSRCEFYNTELEPETPGEDVNEEERIDYDLFHFTNMVDDKTSKEIVAQKEEVKGLLKSMTSEKEETRNALSIDELIDGFRQAAGIKPEPEPEPLTERQGFGK